MEAAAARQREYAAHGWNINNLPRHQASVLRYLEGDELITGVQVRVIKLEPYDPPPTAAVAVTMSCSVDACAQIGELCTSFAMSPDAIGAVTSIAWYGPSSIASCAQRSIMNWSFQPSDGALPCYDGYMPWPSSR